MSMLRYITIAIGSALLFVSGCRNVDEPATVEPELSVATPEVLLPSEGGDFDVVVVANIDYRVEVESAAAEWVHSVESDAAAHSYRFHVDANETFEPREGEVRISACDHAEVWCSVKIRQAESRVPRLSLALRHSQTELCSPTWQGEAPSGVIDWGDGNSEDYVEGATHSYASEGEHTATFDMRDASSFTIKRMGSITDLDIRSSR